LTEITFRLKTSRTEKDLKELLADLACVGVLKRVIVKTEDGFLVTFDREEWKYSWESVGFSGTDYAEMFQEELNGQDFEATVIEQEVRPQPT